MSINSTENSWRERLVFTFMYLYFPRHWVKSVSKSRKINLSIVSSGCNVVNFIFISLINAAYFFLYRDLSSNNIKNLQEDTFSTLEFVTYLYVWCVRYKERQLFWDKYTRLIAWLLCESKNRKDIEETKWQKKSCNGNWSCDCSSHNWNVTLTLKCSRYVDSHSNGIYVILPS